MINSKDLAKATRDSLRTTLLLLKDQVPQIVEEVIRMCESRADAGFSSAEFDLETYCTTKGRSLKPFRENRRFVRPASHRVQVDPFYPWNSTVLDAEDVNDFYNNYLGLRLAIRGGISDRNLVAEWNQHDDVLNISWAGEETSYE